MKIKTFKKVICTVLCSTMAFTLAGCSFNPKNAISTILNGNSQSSSSDVAVNDKVNKDAVFHESKSFSLEGFDYIDSVISANGKYYATQMKYDYTEEEGMLYGENDIDVSEEEEETPDSENPVTEDDNDADATEDTDTEGDSETIDYDDGYDGYYDGETVDVNSEFVIASFTDENDVKYTSVKFEPGEYISGGSSWGVDSDENFYVVVGTYDEQNEREHHVIRKYSADGNMVKELAIGTDSDYYYVNYMRVSGDGTVFVTSENSIDIYDKDLNKTGTYSMDSQNSYISSAIINTQNEFIVQVETWTDDSSSVKVYKIGKDGKAEEDSFLSGMFNGKSMMSGAGYDYYYKTNSSIMGFNAGDKQAKEIVNFYDSDINTDYLGETICFASKEQFLMGSMDGTLCVYEKVPADQVADREIITVGTVWGSYMINSQVIDFNKANNQYRIKVIDYSEYATPDDWEAGVKRFNTDVTGGNTPDIIIAEANEANNYIDKGIYTDLTPLMNNYNGVKKEDLLQSAQDVFSRDGKLYCVYPIFTVEAVQMKKSKYKEGMTLDDVIAWEKSTGKKAFGNDFTKSGMLNTMLSFNMDSFLDPSTGKCSFDSDEFKKLLEYANTYPLEENYSESDDYYTEYMNRYRNDNALFSLEYISSFRDFNWSKNYRFDEDTVLMGMPITGSDGAILQIDTIMGISDKSKHKEAAWEFINSCFSDEFYQNHNWGLPALEKRMDDMAKEATEPSYYIDENGKKVEYEETVYILDREKTVHPLTAEEVAEIKNFVVGIRNVYMWDTELNNIVDEETQPYFSGQKSADEVAKIIQSRLQIYINERK